MKTGISVSDAMTVTPVKVAETEDVAKCAKLMLSRKVGSVLVVSGKKLAGIITEKDIVKKVVARGLNAKKTKAKAVMTRKLVTIEPTVDITEAMELMKSNRIRRLPVVARDGELVGLLTIKDVMAIQPSLSGYVQEMMAAGKLGKKIKIDKSKASYKEGECESCGDYGRLSDVEGRFLCEDCRDEEGKMTEEQAQEED